jgi:hypothetical protein
MYSENEIFGFAFGCPLQRRIVNCPFNKFDHLSFEEKVIWIKSISHEKKKSIIEHHRLCSKNRK